MNRVKTLGGGQWALLVAGGLLILLVAGVVRGTIADALFPAAENQAINGSELSRVSPNPNGNFVYDNTSAGADKMSPGTSLFSTGNANGLASRTGFKHILKNATSSSVNEIRLRSYHTSLAAAQSATYQMRYDLATLSEQRNALRDCYFTDKNLRVTIEVNNVNVYNQPTSRVCNDLDSYVINRRGTPTRLEGTDLYYNEITFSLIAPRPTDNDTNQIRFQIRANDAGAKIGHVGNTGDTNFGLVEGYPSVDKSKNASAVNAFQFARTCSEFAGANGPTAGTITVYDPDTISFGPLYLQVLKRARGSTNTWKPLEIAEYQTGAFSRADSASKKIVIDTKGANNQNVSVLIKEYLVSDEYLMVLDGRYVNTSPVGNLLSFSLPGDPINSQVNCTNADYSLVPKSSVQQTAEAGETVQVTGSVRNTGTDNAGSHDWRTALIRYAPGQTPNATKLPNNGSGNICGNYTPNNQCNEAQFNPSAAQKNFNAGQTQPSPEEFGVDIPANTPVGTTYCFVTSVQSPTAGAAGQWAHSAPSCVRVGIKPKLQVWGYDARVVGKIDTSMSSIGGKQYGSWAEYGLFSNGINPRMASKSGFQGGATSSEQSAWSGLTFANTATPAGQYGGVVQAELKETPTQTLNNLTVGSDPKYADGSRQVIVVNGTLSVKSNLTNQNTQFGSIANIPRVIYIADDVVIDGNVTTIDPWIVAKRIVTCREASPSDPFLAPASVRLTGNGQCNNQLTFNGPVIADKLYAYRTTGGGGGRAEVFNMRGTNFLSSLSGAGSTRPVANTDLVTELPPRF